MFFLILQLQVLFLLTADTLTCYECVPDSDGKCTDTTRECTSQNHRCVVARSLVFQGATTLADVTAKGCNVAELCVGGSVNFGLARTVVNTTCCTTDLCNTQKPGYSSSPNGKKCFSCDGQSCTTTLNCQGDESHCIKATESQGAESQTLKGCASKLMCTNQLTSLTKQYSETQINCCQGDFCNSASSASPALLILIVPLLFSVFFS